MQQSERLINILNKKQIDSFNSYKLTKEDISFIKEVVEGILTQIPQKAFNCAQLSAFLGAVIQDNTNIPLVVLSGHLDYSGKRLFNCKYPLPYSSNKTEINEIWDGHCWVEIPNLILDISFFRTVYYGNISENLKKKIINQFGKGKGTLIASFEQMAKMEFNYTPCYQVDNNMIDGLIKSIGKINYI